MDKLSDKIDILDVNVINALNACSKMLQNDWPYAGAEAILFGSQARGQAGAESDVDLLVLVEETITSEQEKAIHDDIYEISLDFDVVISAIILTKQQWNSPVSAILPLHQNIEREGVLVA